MITIEAPHMGFNDARAPVFVQMAETRRVAATETKRQILDAGVAATRRVSGGRLRSIVISCHGAPGYLQLGEGFGTADAGLFSAWRGLVHKIWIRACLVGRMVGPATAGHGDGAFLGALGMSGDGHDFCRAMARAARCYLVVGTELQSSNRYSVATPVPYGQLDSYEGLVLSYHPDGNVGWRHRYASVYGASPVTLTAINPNSE